MSILCLYLSLSLSLSRSLSLYIYIYIERDTHIQVRVALDGHRVRARLCGLVHARDIIRGRRRQLKLHVYGLRY